MAEEVKTLTEEEIKKMVKEKVEKSEISKDEAKKIEELLCTAGGMSPEAKKIFFDAAFKVGKVLLSAGIFYGIPKAFGYSYIKRGDKAWFYALQEDENGTKRVPTEGLFYKLN